MPLPPFIERDGDPQIPPPYWFPGVTIRSFRLTATLVALQALCDRLLNIGTLAQRGFEYLAFLPFVDLEVLTYPRMESEVPHHRLKGFTAQREAYFRLFVAKFEAIGLGWFPTEIAVFIPFIFVDNNWSVIAGREVVGYPKVQAKIEIPPPKGFPLFPMLFGKPRPYPMTMSTDVFATYGPNTRQISEKVVEIEEASPNPSILGTYSNWPWGVLDLAGLDPQLVRVVQEFMRPDSFSTIQLKQIRDAENTGEACYQALVHGEFQVSGISTPDPLPPAKIAIHSYASLPIVAELGLGSSTLQPLSQYAVKCDMRSRNTYNIFVLP